MSWAVTAQIEKTVSPLLSCKNKENCLFPDRWRRQQWHHLSKYSVTDCEKKEKKKEIQTKSIQSGSVEYDRECQALSHANKLTTAHYASQTPPAPCRTCWLACQNYLRVIKGKIHTLSLTYNRSINLKFVAFLHFPESPMTAPRNRIKKHPACVGGVNEAA